ncbi:hypothetical protein ECC02_012483 [Trypanosoma cruzi]|uniref:Uncharacterized protein n=1 Tax=Trypanosoma cruzi TaxID=5693 RepID=A0A7J6XLY2_TRYCR|nr:hypothetical protein ECC02_012483 [Trypanosoma cruzi]
MGEIACRNKHKIILKQKTQKASPCCNPPRTQNLKKKFLATVQKHIYPSPPNNNGKKRAFSSNHISSAGYNPLIDNLIAYLQVRKFHVARDGTLHLLRRLGGKTRAEAFLEHHHQLFRRLIELPHVLPGLAWVQQMLRHFGDVLRDVQAPAGVLLVFRPVECPVVDRVDDRTRDAQRHALRTTVRAAASVTSVQQPHAAVVLLHLLRQLLAVERRVAHEKWPTKARREDRASSARAASLNAWDVRGVAHHEPEHRLRARQSSHGRHHAKGVVRQENDVLRMASNGLAQRALDVAQRVSNARVLADRLIVEVDLPRSLVQHAVLRHSTEAHGVVDVLLRLRVQADCLGVAAALNVEHATVRPHVLVVADQVAVGVCRQRRLSGPAQSKEDRHIALLAHIRARVHAQVVHSWHQLEHHRQDALLHLTSVLRAKDHLLARLEVQRHARR